SRLAANGETVVFRQQYRPPWPELPPIALRVGFADEESRPAGDALPQKVKWLAGENFRRELAISLEFRVTLPGPAPAEPTPPVLTGFELEWPTLPCLSSLRLVSGTALPLPLSYDAKRRRLRSPKGVPLGLEAGSETADRQVYVTRLILLVESPSDLYLAKELALAGTVDVPGTLLSNLGTAVADATGRILPVPPSGRTRLMLEAQLSLPSIFEQRGCAPAQRWIFPDVVPNEENCNAVMGRLSSRAFRVTHQPVNGDARPGWLLVALGPEITPVDMLVHVTGQRTEVTVETVLPNGERVLAKRPTGTMEIEVRGWPRQGTEADPGMRIRINEVLAEIHRDLRHVLVPRQTQ
ncbi:MAG: hypothetical protein ACKOET_02550, partial [Verrucomicrobiota bacterium]